MVKLFLAKSSHSYDLSYRQRMCLFRRDKRIELLNDSWRRFCRNASSINQLSGETSPRTGGAIGAETGGIGQGTDWRRGFDGRSRRHNCTIRWRLCGGGLLSGLCTGSFIAMAMSMVAML